MWALLTGAVLLLALIGVGFTLANLILRFIDVRAQSPRRLSLSSKPPASLARARPARAKEENP